MSSLRTFPLGFPQGNVPASWVPQGVEKPRCCGSSNAAVVCPKGDRQEAARHLTALGLADSLSLPVRALSGGMKRRVSIARAVLAPGPLLVLDEPFTGLDRTTKAVVLDYLKRYTQGRTLLLVTHDPAERDALAHSTLQMPSQIT